MRTVGEILKNKRLEKKISLEEVEVATKIRVKYLEAVENNDFFHILGGAPITKGFIKNYAEFLGLSSNDLLAVFRRDFLENKTGQIVPRGMIEPLSVHKFSWTPRMTLVAGLVTLFLSLGSYLFYQYSSFLSPPHLQVSLPRNGEVTNQNSIKVVGKTDPEASLYLNRELKIVARDGSFADQVSLSPGENEIMVEAVSRQGQKSRVFRKVTHEP